MPAHTAGCSVAPCLQSGSPWTRLRSRSSSNRLVHLANPSVCTRSPLSVPQPPCPERGRRRRTPNSSAFDCSKNNCEPAARKWASQGLDEPTVDDEVGTGDVGRAPAGQHHDEVGDLVGAGEAARGEAAEAADDLL